MKVHPHNKTVPSRNPSALAIAILLACLSAAGVSEATARDFHVAPRTGSMANDGSAARPWRTLEEVFRVGTQVFQAGDVIYLYDGDHGQPVVSTVIASGAATIRPQTGQSPRMTKLTVTGSRWTISGITVTRAVSLQFSLGQALVYILGNSNRLEKSLIYTADGADGWTTATWLARDMDGIQVDGDDCIVSENTVRSVRTGISLGGARGRAEKNKVEYFCGNGLLGLGDYCIFEYNIARHCYAVDGDHRDGFQSWSRPKGGTGTVYGIVLRGNTIVSGTKDNVGRAADKPLRGKLQGVGCFDGKFQNWLVENNLVIVDHHHGITFGGAIGCRIINNTVLKNPKQAIVGATAKILLTTDNYGHPSSGNLVQNNLVSYMAPDSAVATYYNNIVINGSANNSYASHFVNYGGFDCHLKYGSTAISTGRNTGAPPRDLDYRARTGIFDIGCYEYFVP